jgi:hypothetical protein
MTPIEVLKMLQCKINEAKFYNTNYVLQKNDIEMIAEALRIHDVSGSLGFHEGYEKGWTDATSQAISEIQKNYKPNDR